MSARAGGHPSGVRLWAKSALFVVVGAIMAGLLAYQQWYVMAIGFAVVSVWMAVWVSPRRRGMHTAWSDAMMQRSDGRAIIVWSPVDRASSQIQVGLRPDDARLVWVNALHDPEAMAFVDAHGGFDELPIAVVGERVLPKATSGAVLDALVVS